MFETSLPVEYKSCQSESAGNSYSAVNSATATACVIVKCAKSAINSAKLANPAINSTKSATKSAKSTNPYDEQLAWYRKRVAAIAAADADSDAAINKF